MGNRSKYRRLPDLYIRGTELVLEDGLVMWLQVLNPFEVEEARKDAQVARARLALAMKTVGSPEYDHLKAAFALRGEANAIEDLVGAKHNDEFLKATQDIEVDPEWKERVEIMRRSDEIMASASVDDPERVLLTQIHVQWMDEVTRRVAESADLMREQLSRLSFEELLEEYQNEWIERRGGNAALMAYNTTEMFYAARVCDAEPDEGYFGADAHASCNHKERVFESRDEVRELPTELVEAIRGAFDSISMSIRDAKNSRRLLSSSESSQQPEAQADSSASTPTETSSSAPGL